MTTLVFLVGGSNAGRTVELSRCRAHDIIELPVREPMPIHYDPPSEPVVLEVNNEAYRIHEFVFGDAPGFRSFIAAPASWTSYTAVQELLSSYRRARQESSGPS